MTGRQRLAASLAHRSPDRVAVDFGASFVTGIHVSAVTRLRRQVLGDSGFRVKVNEPYQMLGEIDDELRAALPIDVIGAQGRKSIFGTESRDWKPFTLFDGTECLVPGQFNVTPAPDGGWHIYPEGDTSARPSGHMPRAGISLIRLCASRRSTKTDSTQRTTWRSSLPSMMRTSTIIARRSAISRSAATSAPSS